MPNGVRQQGRLQQATHFAELPSDAHNVSETLVPNATFTDEDELIDDDVDIEEEEEDLGSHEAPASTSLTSMPAICRRGYANPRA